MFATATIRDVAPHPDAVRLTGSLAIARRSNGYHSGGAWLLEGEVWKPLDGCVDGSAVTHVPTLEERVLTEMAGQSLFPENFRFVNRNGRRWVVRPQSTIVGTDGDNDVFVELIPYTFLTAEQVLEVEAGVRNLNAHGWEVNDEIQVAFGPKSPYPLFLYDLSAAQYRGPDDMWQADDHAYLERFMAAAGHQYHLTLRKKARSAYIDVKTEIQLGLRDGDPDLIFHVYANMYRPFMSFISWWPKEIERIVVAPEESPSWSKVVPHEWIFTREPIPTEFAKRYDLQWAYSPIEYIWETKGNRRS
jgi:hypothetical protein